MWKEFGRLTGRDGDVKADCTQRLRDVLDRVKLETGCGGEFILHVSQSDKVLTA